MSSDGGVVVLFDDFTAEGNVLGNIDASTVEDEAVFIVPVLKSLCDRLRTVLQDCFHGSLYDVILAFSVLDTLGKLYITFIMHF